MWASHASPEGRRTVSGHSPLCSPVFSSVSSAWQRYPASHASCQREPALEGFVWHCSWIWPLHWGTTNCAGSSLRGDLSLVFHLSQRARGPLRDLGYWWVDVSTAILLWNDWHTSCCGPALGPVLPKIHYFEYVLPCLLRLMLSMLLANELGSRKKKIFTELQVTPAGNIKRTNLPVRWGRWLCNKWEEISEEWGRNTVVISPDLDIDDHQDHSPLTQGKLSREMMRRRGVCLAQSRLSVNTELTELQVGEPPWEICVREG